MIEKSHWERRRPYGRDIGGKRKTLSDFKAARKGEGRLFLSGGGCCRCVRFKADSS